MLGLFVHHRDRENKANPSANAMLAPQAIFRIVARHALHPSIPTSSGQLPQVSSAGGSCEVVPGAIQLGCRRERKAARRNAGPYESLPAAPARCSGFDRAQPSDFLIATGHFLIATAARLEIGATCSKQGTKLFLIATETGTFGEAKTHQEKPGAASGGSPSFFGRLAVLASGIGFAARVVEDE
jgi:hypothetical protein